MNGYEGKHFKNNETDEVRYTNAQVVQGVSVAGEKSYGRRGRPLVGEVRSWAAPNSLDSRPSAKNDRERVRKNDREGVRKHNRWHTRRGADEWWGAANDSWSAADELWNATDELWGAADGYGRLRRPSIGRPWSWTALNRAPHAALALETR
jgi:hypothetical protein